jgi:NADH-quinone oxidoreductase subunit N
MLFTVLSTLVLCSDYVGLFSEIYLFISFFVLLTISISINLSKEINFPNVYSFTSFFIVLFGINVICIDIWNCLEIYYSFDFYKNIADIIVKIIILLFTIVFLLYSDNYMKKIKMDMFEYVIVVYLTVLSFSLFIITTDLLNFYLLLEIQSLCFYLLTAFNKYNQYSVESGLKYFILSSFSSVSLLFGYSFIYGLVGSLNFMDINIFLSMLVDNGSWGNSYSVASILILLAFLFKLYVAPFHLWVSDVYQGAPTISTAFFGTITTLPLFYIFIKYFVSFFYWVQPYICILLLVFSVLSMFLGLLGAIYQKKIKRLVAFSSVSNIGYLLIGFIQENPIALSYSIGYLLLYMINITGIFIIFLNLWMPKLNIFMERLTLLSGFIFKNKWLAMMIIFFFFTAAGIPPFSLFIAKILILTGVSYMLYTIILFILVFSAITSGFYYLRVIKYISFNVRNEWVFVSSISYVNSLFIIYFAFISILFLLIASEVYMLSDYVILGLM